MRTPSRLLLGVVLTAGAVLGPAAPVLAAGTGTTTVRPAAEAWYRTTPACALPTGCPDLGATPSPYAPDTLHVGVNAGAEEARTYLQLDLARLPAGTRPTGGTLLLPVSTAPDDGTRAPESARLQACAVGAAVQDVDGSFAAPPEADCEAASVPVELLPATAETPLALTVDLAPLVTAWADGATPGALALLPAADSAPPESWHVAFSDRTRTGEGVVPISAALAFVSSAVDTSGEAPPVVPPPAFEPAPAGAFAPSSDLVLDSAPTAFAPALDAAPVLSAPLPPAAPAPLAAAPGAQQVVPVASLVQGGFRYPAVFLLPLLLAVAAGWLGRALTRDLAED